MFSADRRRAAPIALALGLAATGGPDVPAQDAGRTFTFQGGGSFGDEGSGPPPLDGQGGATPPPIADEGDGPPPLDGEAGGPPPLAGGGDGPPPIDTAGGGGEGPPPLDDGGTVTEGPEPENGTHMPGGPWPAVPGAPEPAGPDAVVTDGPPPEPEDAGEQTGTADTAPLPPDRPGTDNRPVSPADPVLAYELQDFGVPASGQIHQGAPHAPTPTSIPGGRLITTGDLAPLVAGNRVALIDVLGGNRTLPGAVNAAGMGATGYPEQQVQAQVQQFLAQLTGGRRDLPMVIFCSDPMCWLSYNASLRAIRAGYTRVHWYRGGIEAWQRAGQRLVTAQGGWQ